MTLPRLRLIALAALPFLALPALPGVALAAPSAPLPAPLASVLPSSTADSVSTLASGGPVTLDALVVSPHGAKVVLLHAPDTTSAKKAAHLLNTTVSAASEDSHVTAGLATEMKVDSVPAGSVVRVAGASSPNQYYQWDLPKINATGARALVASSLPSITVAVLDTGVAANAKLTPYLVPGQNFSSSDPTNPTDTTDNYWHGTHVAGTIAAAADGTSVEGVAAGVKIMPVKVLSDTGSGTSTTVASGITWAADHGADVISMSLSGGDDPTLQSAVSYARSKGAVVIAAAGNSAQSGNAVMYPCADPGAVCVAATDVSDAWATFSEYGPQVTLSAPGVDIPNLYLTSGLSVGSGTSMATPHVAALAAMVKAVSRSFTPDQVASILTSTSVDLGPAGRDDKFGAGRIDAFAALKAAFAQAGKPLPVNHAPTASDLSVNVPQSTSATTISVQGHIADPDSDELWFTGVGAAAGTVSLANQQIQYTPPASGTATSDAFTYTVSDERGASATATVHLTIGAPPGPAAPTNLNATPGDSSVSLSWTASTSASSYKVYRNAAYLTQAGGTSFTDVNLQNGTSYTYQVSAVSSTGVEGSLSSAVIVKPVSSLTPIQKLYTALNGAAGVLGSPTSGETPASGGGTQETYQNGVITLAPGASTAHYVTGSILTHWNAWGGLTGSLGYPSADPTCGLANNGCTQTFSGGTIAYSATTSAFVVHNALLTRWTAWGLQAGSLGYPTADENCPAAPAGCTQTFQGGTIAWSSATGAFVVHNDILTRWNAWGTVGGSLGYPTADENCPAAPAGCTQTFSGGTIAWSSATGSHVVHGALLDRWTAWGTVGGSLGFPTADENCPTSGCTETFSGGTIAWSSATGSHVVHGTLLSSWNTWGTTGGSLGFPTADENCPTAPAGCTQTFSGGTIVSSSATGSHVVHGALLDRWNAWGTIGGTLGFPTADEVCNLANGGCMETFQGGNIAWTSTTGSHVVHGNLLSTWSSKNYQSGPLGYPTSDEICSSTSCSQTFQGGNTSASK